MFYQTKMIYLMCPGAVGRRPRCSDYERPLSPTGRRAVLHQIQVFRDRPTVRPDCLIVSTARRSRQTAYLLSQLFVGAPVFFRETLYLAPSFRILEVLHHTDEIFRRVMIIAHRPGLEQLLMFLTPSGQSHTLHPADCVALAVDKPWAALQAGDCPIYTRSFL